MENGKSMEKEKDYASVEIVNRFFAALSRLREDGCIRGLKTITDRYGLNRRNVAYLRDNPTECVGRFRPSWLLHLVRDYHVSPYWLLLGSGDFYSAGFSPEPPKNRAQTARKNSTLAKR